MYCASTRWVLDGGGGWLVGWVEVGEGLALGAKLLQSGTPPRHVSSPVLPFHACCDLAVTCVHGNHVGSPTCRAAAAAVSKGRSICAFRLYSPELCAPSSHFRVQRTVKLKGEMRRIERP